MVGKEVQTALHNFAWQKKKVFLSGKICEK